MVHFMNMDVFKVNSGYEHFLSQGKGKITLINF